MICDNIAKVLRKIGSVKQRAGRKDEVKLIAVCKGFPYEVVREAYRCGVRAFGENRIQEAETKVARSLEEGLNIEWHMIGHLQSNKAKKAVEMFDWIESLDSVRIAERVSTYAIGLGKVVNVLLEVNISGEPQKSGFNSDEVVCVFPEIFAFDGIKVLGLMGIAPYTKDVSAIRASFARLRGLMETINDKYGVGLSELSMGMSNDFEIAIEEGSTMVRVGRAIFGERNG